MLSRSRIFPTPPFSDSDNWVENFLENTQKFYDGGARSTCQILRQQKLVDMCNMTSMTTSWHTGRSGSVVEALPHDREVVSLSPARADRVKPKTLK
jgi:hypothetical protein